MNPSSLLYGQRFFGRTQLSIIFRISSMSIFQGHARFLRAFFGISYYVVCGVTMSFYYKIWDSFTWGCDFHINKHVTGLCGFLIAATGSNKFINPLAPSEHITYRDVLFQTNICTHVLAERRLALSIHSHWHRQKEGKKSPLGPKFWLTVKRSAARIYSAATAILLLFSTAQTSYTILAGHQFINIIARGPYAQAACRRLGLHFLSAHGDVGIKSSAAAAGCLLRRRDKIDC